MGAKSLDSPQVEIKTPWIGVEDPLGPLSGRRGLLTEQRYTDGLEHQIVWVSSLIHIPAVGITNRVSHMPYIDQRPCVYSDKSDVVGDYTSYGFLLYSFSTELELYDWLHEV